MNKKISNKDKKDWEKFLSENETLPDKDLSPSKTKPPKTVSFDLHGFSLDEANEEVKNLITNSYERGINKLIIVTGKGLHSQNEKDPYISKDLGILKYSVPEYIKSNDELMKMINEIKESNIIDGGSGAFYINIKKNLQNKF